MRREMIMVGLAVVLLSGCGNEKKEPVAVESAPPAKAVEQAPQTATEMTQAAQEKVQQTADKVVEKAQEVKAEAEKVVQQTSDKVAGLAGQAVYTASCKSCHANGIMGAPKLGDKKFSGDLETLVKNSINGVGRMPAKGGVSSLSDDKVRAAVEYMVEQSK